MVELQKFVDYISRQEAIRQDEQKIEYTDEELEELQRIEQALSDMGQSTEQPLIQDITTMDKYIDYMTRKQAILENADREIVNGAFSNKKRHVTQADVKEIKEAVIEAKENQSVMFQDVISFDNQFLIDEGYYDPDTKKLNEDVLYNATKGMMDKLVEKEQLHDAFWFASIHRNTDNIHIHVTCMERVNTREVMEWHGEKQARGKRKQSTLDEMIFKFGSKMVDRNKELESISDLRKEIPLELKQEVKDHLLMMYVRNDYISDKVLEKKYHDVKKVIPEKTRGYNELSDDAKKRVDDLTAYLTKDNPKVKEYHEATKKMDELYQQTYGKRYKANEFFENRDRILKERMGNTVVREVKKMKYAESHGNNRKEVENILKNVRTASVKGNGQPQFKTKYGSDEYNKFRNELEQRRVKREKSNKFFQKKSEQAKDRKDINKISRAVNDNMKMYRAEQDYERVQEEINRIKKQREQGFDYE